MAKELEKNYNPAEIEPRLYEKWVANKYFHAEVDRSKKPFTIVMPPPNITGQLHMGHALDNTMQDILIRFKRMQGYNALWQPGTDHAAIATEVKVIEALKKEGIDKEDLGREKFLERVWDWRREYGGKIVNQLKKMGSSADWDRERFTMDEGNNKAVTEVFCKLYEKGYMYRGSRIVNWCPVCQTSISDAEVVHEEQDGFFWHINYPVVGEEGRFVEIATTRPETLLGDTAVAVNPEDERYKDIVGKMLKLPLTDREIPVIADEYVDKDFGTGCVKITPAHDPNDFEVGKRHNLEEINIMNDDATINKLGGKYAGMDRYEARKAMVADLDALGLLVKVVPHKHMVGTHDRCKTTVEPLVKPQWFVKMSEMAKPAKEAVVSGKLASPQGGYGTNSMVYAEGMVFVQLDNGCIQALRADTLESLWVTESFGVQTISPITYYNGYIYTGVWGGETKEQNFACFSVTDEDPANGFETKYATWLRPHAGGYYWVGAYVNDVCAVFGSDDGTSDSNSPTAVLYSVNPVTGSVIDTINDVKGDIRCCVVYDSGRVYFTTKGGYLYSVGLNSNGTFDHASIKSIQIGSMSTSTPVIYKGRLYVGCSGKGYDWDGDSGSGIAVVDVSGGKLDIIYKASTPGYPQAGPLVSTAFESSTGKVYVYTTYNNNPGGIYIIEDSAGQTEPSANNGNLYVPETYQNFCISTICADSEGTLYYKNDSGALIAVKSTAKLPDPPKPTPTPGDDDGYKPGWPGGSILGPGSNSNVPTPPTAEMPVTGGKESILPIAMLIAGAVMLVALRRKKRV